uniref:Yip1 domain-containing protein n=1 Tax=Panagrolaimus sp. ES5 TaxID=591445 RepID=A0AC34GW03_9BILA
MSDLNFQNFGLDDSPFTNPNTDRRNPTSVKDTSNLVSGNIDLNEDTQTDSKLPNAHNIFSFKYYQQFFDVDQEQVYNRLLRSVIPAPKSNFILDHVQPLPDLYGPLWICITFVFSTAICGNLAHYIETHGQDRYENDFGLVTGATSLITSYVIFVPFILYWALWYRKSEMQYSYLELLSAYGYSLATFVPVSILWVIHFHWFRWILILAAIGIGGLMLYNIVWPAVKNDPNRAIAFAIVGGVLFLHASLALGFKAYYFDSVIPSQHAIIEQPVAPTPPAAVPSGVIPEQAVDTAKKPEAAALVAAGEITNVDSVKKVTQRDTVGKEADAPKPTEVVKNQKKKVVKVEEEKQKEPLPDVPENQKKGDEKIEKVEEKKDVKIEKVEEKKDEKIPEKMKVNDAEKKENSTKNEISKSNGTTEASKTI